LDRQQGEATASQLGWHPAEPPSYTANLKEKFIKKRGKSTRGETRPKPSKNKEETTKKETANRKKKETPDYGNRERGNPLRSKKKSV
jgi:hypothetical protein